MSCPPRHVLQALSDPAGLPPGQAAEVEAHVVGCPACTKVLEEFSNVDPALEILFERRRLQPAPVPPPAPDPGSAFGRWGRAALVAAAAAFGLTVALGVRVREQTAALRDATAAADGAARRAAAADRLADLRSALTRGLGALEDGEPGAAEELARTAAAARAAGDDPDLDDTGRAAAASLAARAAATGAPGRVLFHAPAHAGYRARLAVLTPFTPAGQRLLTVAADARVVVWDADTGAPVGACVLRGDPGRRFEAVAASPDGWYVAAGGDDGRVWVWLLPGRGEVGPVGPPIDPGLGGPAWVVWFTRPRVATEVPPLWAAGADGAARRCEYVPGAAERPAAGAPPADLDREPGPGPRVGPVRWGRPVVAAGTDPSGRFAFSADPEGTFRYWDAATRTPLGPPTATPGPPPR